MTRLKTPDDPQHPRILKGEGYNDDKPTAETRTLQAGIYIVATPLGNIRDITLRTLEILRAADLVLCEDTRVSRKLLTHYGITTPLKAFHDHNESKMIPSLLARLREGKSLALISDAGTPLICDPGYKLVRAAIAEGIPITALPGPSAAINALILSGLPNHRFFFAGFMPAKSAVRLRDLESLRHIPATLIFYESPQRLQETLEDLREHFLTRQIVVAREMTKKFEEVIRGSLMSVTDHFSKNPARGEIVLLIGPPAQEDNLWIEENLAHALETALKKSGLKEAVLEVSALSGVPRKIVYQKALDIQEKSR